MSWWTFQASELHFERLTHSSCVLYAFLVHRRILIFFFVHREHTKNTSICWGENARRCSQSVTFWYSKKCSGHVKIILSEGVTVQIGLIFPFFFSLKESVTDSTLKSRWISRRAKWTKPGICHGSSKKFFYSFHGAERSFSSGSRHWNRQKNSQNERDVWIQLGIQCGRQWAWGFCSPDQRAFQRLHSM